MRGTPVAQSLTCCMINYFLSKAKGTCVLPHKRTVLLSLALSPNTTLWNEGQMKSLGKISEIAETHLSKWNIFNDGNLDKIHLQLVYSAVDLMLSWRSSWTIRQHLHTKLSSHMNAFSAHQGCWASVNFADLHAFPQHVSYGLSVLARLHKDEPWWLLGLRGTLLTWGVAK